jgi:hypothetical protein
MPRIDDDRRESLAVNLFDLDRVDPTVRQILLAGKLDLTRVIRINPDRPDETAVAFTCDLLTAACICDVIRTHDRAAGDHPCRVYLRRSKAWERLPGAAVLSVLDDGKAVLNPDLFGSPVEPPRSFIPKPVELGG